MRAILLVAGKGTRLKPLTDTIPKPLIKVNGLPLVERQIQYLQERKITEIILVTGHLKEKFNYLIPKYNVKIVYNDKYDIYNNLYSMYLVRHYLQDAYVLEGDIYMTSNIFQTSITESTYFSPIKYDFKDEWILKTNKDNGIEDIIIGSTPASYIMCGISYWTKADGLFIKNKLEEAITNNTFKNNYWDNIIKDNIKDLNIKICELDESALYEIDTLEDLKKIKCY